MIATIFSDFIVNATDLRKNQRDWLEKAYENPITINYGQKQLVIMNRDLIRSMYMRNHYTEFVIKVCEDFLKERKSTIIPWVEYLSDEEKLQFHKELITSAMRLFVTDNSNQLEELIDDWKATAEIKQYPEREKELLNEVKPEQYVSIE